MENEARRRLIESARSGQLTAQEELIKAYQQRIAGFIYSLTGEAESIEDLAQHTFIKMVHGLHGLKQTDKFESWLFRMARNVCLSHLRRRKWRRAFVPFLDHHDSIAPEPDDQDMTPERSEWLRGAMAALPLQQRELLALLQDREMSYEDLARITGTTVGSVKSRLFRAREQLKEWRNREF